MKKLTQIVNEMGPTYKGPTGEEWRAQREREWSQELRDKHANSSAKSFSNNNPDQVIESMKAIFQGRINELHYELGEVYNALEPLKAHIERIEKFSLERGKYSSEDALALASEEAARALEIIKSLLNRDDSAYNPDYDD